MVGRWPCLVLGLFAITSFVFGNDRTHPRIPGYERFYAAPLPAPVDEDEEPIKLDPVTGGRILLGELNCASCHAIDSVRKLSLATKKAPVLDEVGGRVRPEWLREYLANPHTVKPGTTMPDMIATLPVDTQAATVEALTHFLVSTEPLIESRPDPIVAQKGLDVIRKVGCLACHNGMEANSPDIGTSVPLPDIGKKYSTPSLVEFLKDPLKARPSGRMPDLALTEEELRSVANYLVHDGPTTPNVKYSVYHGTWKVLPNFNDLNSLSSGETNGFDLSVTNRRSDFAIRFSSFLRIVKPGDYRFWLGSDDGSKLFIDDELIVDCDGLHPYERRNGQTTLVAGVHRVVVEYFEAGDNPQLSVQIAGTGINRMPLSGLLTLEPQVPISTPDRPAFSVDDNLVKKGRELFATIGCAACHALKIDGQSVASKLFAKPLTANAENKTGCLAENVTGAAPRYGLNALQRASIAAALKTQSDEPSAESVHRALATMNCYACHERSKLGGVEDARNASFESLQKEMGDEGRLPPSLTGVGDKLRPEWLRHVLNQSTRDRKNYMVVRMPKFGQDNVGSLVDLFETVDRRSDPLPEAIFPEPEYRVKAMGRHLVGGQGLGCIKCHDFGAHASTGIRAISLTTMYQRLRPEWFYRYVLDPQVYRRGTRMPAAWPFGQATVRDVLNGNVNLQVQAVWAYLSDRDKAALPSGLVRELIELKPETEPVIYRNFIEGAGTRAIGVGYPEGVNLAFDANDMRLAMIWHGAFIDASRHWNGRGQGFEPPLGDDLIPLPDHLAFLTLDQPDREAVKETGREAGYKFLGYRLDAQQRPIFRYSLPGLVVEDNPVPDRKIGKFATLKRTLQFAGSADTRQLWFRTIVAEKIETLKEGSYQIDNLWTLEINSNSNEKPLVRDSAGKKELLVPIRLKDQHAEISLHYVW